MFWSSCVSLSLRLQTSWGSDFLRQFVSGNWSFQLQLSVSWELLRKKKECSSFSKCWWIQHNEHVTDHKDRQIRFFFLRKRALLLDWGETNTILASSIDVMLKRLSVAHCYSLTAPVGIATGCISLFFCQKSLNRITALSAYCKLQARTVKHSVL